MDHDLSKQELNAEQLNMIFIYLTLCLVSDYTELDLNEKISYSILEDKPLVSLVVRSFLMNGYMIFSLIITKKVWNSYSS